jgi:hypothetical protein
MAQVQLLNAQEQNRFHCQRVPESRNLSIELRGKLFEKPYERQICQLMRSYEFNPVSVLTQLPGNISIKAEVIRQAEGENNLDT